MEENTILWSIRTINEKIEEKVFNRSSNNGDE
jgi:hypothetical protein